MRFACCGKFSNDLVLEKLSMAKILGIDKAKLYLMVGLPGKTGEDISAVSPLCRRIVDETGLLLSLSVNPFVPKLRTRWKAENFVGAHTIKEKYEKIKKKCGALQKTPKLRLTGIKEAEAEFQLAWYGYKESLSLAAAVENGTSRLPECDRARTAEEIEKFI